MGRHHDDRNHNYEKKKSKKTSKMSKRERLAEELRNRASKGKNAYGSGSGGVKSRAEQDQKYRERLNSKMPALLGKQLPSSTHKKKHHHIDREKNNRMDTLIKSNNVLGSPLTTMQMPTSKIKSKKKDSYEKLKESFNKKKITAELVSEAANADILDDF